MTGNASTLVVHRPGGYYVNVALRYWIELDGQRTASGRRSTGPAARSWTSSRTR
jgi:hypothetical protein